MQRSNKTLIIVICKGGNDEPFTYEWVDMRYVLSLAGQTGKTTKKKNFK